MSWTSMERLMNAKAGVRSLTDAIDTATPAGRVMMQMIASFTDESNEPGLGSGGIDII